MFYLIFIFSLIYAIILFLFTAGIISIKKKTTTEYKGISVIIAARNEEKNISHILTALSEVDYPVDKFEIIIANDRSEDRTEEIIIEHQKNMPNIKLVNIYEEDPDLIGKKGALNRAIENSTFKHLVFTDADCLPSKNWLLEINSNWTDEVDFWAGYSPLILDDPLISYLKNLERASIFAVTAGTFGLNWGVTCTARNMGYRKDVFINSAGFDGIGHIRSGDDDLLLQKMSSSIRKYNFLFGKDSYVWSKDRNDLKDQMDLETRRGSKWKHYPFSIKLLSLFVFLYYLTFISGIFLTVAGIISLKQILILLIIKILAEFLLLSTFLTRVGMLKLLLVFPIAEVFYIPYFVYFGIRGTLGKYKWK
jgi:glycosyltransferase involved in cell wall biosynthesis